MNEGGRHVAKWLLAVRLPRVVVAGVLMLPLLAQPSEMAQARAISGIQPIVVEGWPRGLFTINPRTGDRITHLVSGKNIPRNPMWSPDGKKIIYGARYDNNLEMWVVRRNGSGRRQITRNHLLDWTPSWAPNSKRVVEARFDGNSGTSAGGLYVVRASGSGGRRLTHNSEDECPAWSPDGSSIAFDRSWHIFTIRPSGHGLKQLTKGPATDRSVMWSPDGRKIIFRRLTGNTTPSKPGHDDLYVIGRNGGDLVRLTHTSDSEFAAWSPDGTKIAYVTPVAGDPDHAELHVMDSDGSNDISLANRGYGSGSVAWSRNSDRVIFDGAGSNGYGDLWSAKVDGSDTHPLTSTPKVSEGNPDWFSSGQCSGLY